MTLEQVDPDLERLRARGLLLAPKHMDGPVVGLNGPVLAGLWGDGEPDVVLEVKSMLAESSGTAKLAASVAGVRPVPLGNGESPSRLEVDAR